MDLRRSISCMPRDPNHAEECRDLFLISEWKNHPLTLVQKYCFMIIVTEIFFMEERLGFYRSISVNQRLREQYVRMLQNMFFGVL